MITPLDIQNKEFSKTVFGYSSKSVDVFLDELIDDYEKLYKENIELKDKINMMSGQLSQYKTVEETLKNTLVLAQTTADELNASARQRANLIIEEGKKEGKKIIEQANDSVKEIIKEHEYLKNEIFLLKTKFQSYLKAQLTSIDDFYEKIEKDSNFKINNKNDIDIDKEIVNMD